MRKWTTGGLLAAVLVAVGWQFAETQPADAQSGSSQPRRLAGSTFEDQFWNWLQRKDYTQWAPWPGQGEGAYEGQAPHGAFLKMYLNRKAAANPANPPDRSIIVKENYGKDGKTLMAVTVMFRSQGYSPQHGDWYWVKYLPDGRVDRKGDMRLAGRVQGCIDCHAGADGGDYLFAND